VAENSSSRNDGGEVGCGRSLRRRLVLL
jgi:hypothetical protein